ncbi:MULTISPECIES: GGDEF domain-containing protein [Pseudomonas]|uniref:diguanylate cyclase n=2 Tax=Pseudomonas chlororaphis TaxID=587753 RepID=A0AAD0ZNS2_9PSED|nr:MULTISPECIES: GGDEF domain-containing protein [Pseudomonas]AZE01653.1 GGDEF domain protein [Pseudomonas chlororaphis subsp. aureofaciens]AZE07772.1 GGDEF domain protein [Pseudomonas chlororaphis subsp. aureofaciens]AZE26287.1 GGDEF domain protein [Pseudomonas chlororaphis subsp. aureofaciens]AZE32529.1 GGDEF domain protein [Pseudomonas chlororaphis subsp. aureofaciens]AZE38810.1 GGDEF domain protein [Pseudomonas chlororaphis subsp. aureofaciens]
MPRSSAVRFSHFLPSLLLLLAGLAAAYVKDLNVFFTSLFNVLPTLVLLLGGAYCAVYRRQRELFLMVTVYIAYFLLDTQTDYYRDNGKVREDAAVVFHLVCLLLPLLFGLFAAWQERTHLFQDMVARFAVLLAFGSVALGLEQSYPQALLTWLAEIRWPALHGAWMSLIQLSYPVFLAAFLLLAIQYWRNPRPLHAAQLVGLLGLFWMLPKTFILPFTLNIMCSQVMLMIAAAVAHEAYQMAFRDELTGLPGRRALNERMQRLGRNYVLAMSDVDHFKKFNDTHGHDVGDQVLRLVASKLSKVSGGGRAYRYGGEEFAVVFAGKTLEECMPHLEVIRETIANYNIQLRNQENRPQDDQQGRQRRGAAAASSVSVTVSIGVAERQMEHRSPEEVLKSADQALYSAKGAGRNCVMAFGQNRRGAVRMDTAAG